MEAAWWLQEYETRVLEAQERHRFLEHNAAMAELRREEDTIRKQARAAFVANVAELVLPPGLKMQLLDLWESKKVAMRVCSD